MPVANNDVVPAKLYKYQPCTLQTLENLRRRVLWFSKPSSFNDPFDLSIDLVHRVYTETEVQRLAEQASPESPYERALWERRYLSNGRPNTAFRLLLDGTADALSYRLLAANEKSGVACFSQAPDDILMWAHYADGHRGLCLEFDTRFASFENARRVSYCAEMPISDLVPAFHPEPQDFSAWQLTKASPWEYEHEWRILQPEGNKELKIDPAALTGVHFGCAMSIVHRDIIAAILRDSPTELYDMWLSTGRFVLHSLPVKLRTSVPGGDARPLPLKIYERPGNLDASGTKSDPVT